MPPHAAFVLAAPVLPLRQTNMLITNVCPRIVRINRHDTSLCTLFSHILFSRDVRVSVIEENIIIQSRVDMGHILVKFLPIQICRPKMAVFTQFQCVQRLIELGSGHIITHDLMKGAAQADTSSSGEN